MAGQRLASGKTSSQVSTSEGRGGETARSLAPREGMVERYTAHTIRMPDLAQELHLGWTQRVVFWKLEFGRKDSSFEGRLFGSFDPGLPEEHVCFGHGAGEDAFGWRVEDEAVFVEEAFGRYGGGHVWDRPGWVDWVWGGGLEDTVGEDDKGSWMCVRAW